MFLKLSESGGNSDDQINLTSSLITMLNVVSYTMISLATIMLHYYYKKDAFL